MLNKKQFKNSKLTVEIKLNYSTKIIILSNQSKNYDSAHQYPSCAFLSHSLINYIIICYNIIVIIIIMMLLKIIIIIIIINYSKICKSMNESISCFYNRLTWLCDIVCILCRFPTITVIILHFIFRYVILFSLIHRYD